MMRRFLLAAVLAALCMCLASAQHNHDRGHDDYQSWSSARFDFVRVGPRLVRHCSLGVTQRQFEGS